MIKKVSFIDVHLKNKIRFTNLLRSIFYVAVVKIFQYSTYLSKFSDLANSKRINNMTTYFSNYWKYLTNRQI